MFLLVAMLLTAAPSTLSPQRLAAHAKVVGPHAVVSQSFAFQGVREPWELITTEEGEQVVFWLFTDGRAPFRLAVSGQRVLGVTFPEVEPGLRNVLAQFQTKSGPRLLVLRQWYSEKSGRFERDEAAEQELSKNLPPDSSLKAIRARLLARTRPSPPPTGSPLQRGACFWVRESTAVTGPTVWAGGDGSSEWFLQVAETTSSTSTITFDFIGLTDLKTEGADMRWGSRHRLLASVECDAQDCHALEGGPQEAVAAVKSVYPPRLRAALQANPFVAGKSMPQVDAALRPSLEGQPSKFKVSAFTTTGQSLLNGVATLTTSLSWGSDDWQSTLTGQTAIDVATGMVRADASCGPVVWTRGAQPSVNGFITTSLHLREVPAIRCDMAKAELQPTEEDGNGDGYLMSPTTE